MENEIAAAKQAVKDRKAKAEADAKEKILQNDKAEMAKRAVAAAEAKKVKEEKERVEREK